MAHVLQFGEVLEAADQLSHDEQEELIGILRRRLAQASRQRLVADRPVAGARHFPLGGFTNCRVGLGF